MRTMYFTRRGFLKTTAAAAAGPWWAPAVRAGETGRLRAGAAVADMTPQVGVSMKGPIGGNGVVRTVHDPLHARCLALDDGRRRLAFCVCDATMIWEKSMERAKRLVEERIGLPPSSVLISASHSHATPRISGMADEPVDKRYYDYVERQIAEAIIRAVDNLAPAKVGWGAGSEPQFVELRRFRIEPGSNGPNPFGEYTDRAWMYAKPQTRLGAEGRPDPRVSVLSVRHADDRPLAVLANYSIHYTSGFSSNAVSADFYPCFAERMTALLGGEGIDPPFVGIMSNGNSGNIGPARGGYEGMHQVGDALARGGAAGEREDRVQRRSVPGDARREAGTGRAASGRRANWMGAGGSGGHLEQAGASLEGRLCAKRARACGVSTDGLAEVPGDPDRRPGNRLQSKRDVCRNRAGDQGAEPA